MERYRADALARWAAEVLRASGITVAHAELTAHALVRSSLRGIDTHGVARLPGYVERIQAGDVRNAEPTSAWRDGVLHVDGGGALGQVVAAHAVESLLRATRSVAMAACLVADSGHMAALGGYVLTAAERGCVALLCQRTPPVMGLPGSAGASIGNNPLAFAAPVAGGPPLVFDMASSVAARGHIMQAVRDGRPIPSHWAVDPSGKPTDDPALALRGHLQPMAGHKGLGLAMVVEVLASGLDGWRTEDVVSPGPSGSAAGVRAFLLVINPALLCGQQLFEDGMRNWLGQFLAMSGRGARYPGQRQASCEQDRRAGGVPIGPTLVRELLEIGRSTGCPFDLVPG